MVSERYGERLTKEQIAGTTGTAPENVAINPLVLGTWFALLAGLGEVFLFDLLQQS